MSFLNLSPRTVGTPVDGLYSGLLNPLHEAPSSSLNCVLNVFESAKSSQDSAPRLIGGRVAPLYPPVVSTQEKDGVLSMREQEADIEFGQRNNEVITPSSPVSENSVKTNSCCSKEVQQWSKQWLPFPIVVTLFFGGFYIASKIFGQD
jgi:hypothetical protein